MVIFISANEKWQEGMISGTVYSGEEKLTQIITKVSSAKSLVLECLNLLNVINVHFGSVLLHL